MSTINKRATSLQPNYVSKTEVVDDFLYDIDKLLAQSVAHFDKKDNMEPPKTEGDYRKFEFESDHLYFEIIAEKDEKAVLRLEYRDNQGDNLEHVEGKLEKVWDYRIETVLERGERNYD